MSMTREQSRWAILKVLSEAERPMGAAQVAGGLLAMGIDLPPRTVRHYLLIFDGEGLTRLVSRRLGRMLTDKGRNEMLRNNPSDRLGIISAKVDTLGYRMSFDLASGEGTVIVNVSFVDRVDLSRALREIQLVMNQSLGVGSKIAVAAPGETIGGVIVPEGVLGLGTICSITLNGIMQKAGIPVVSRFGGLLEIRERKITRFLNMIEYSGSTLDPLEVFLRADMTRVRDVVLRGSGIICASFREIPSAALDHIKSVERSMKVRGLGGILELGRPGQPLFGIPVAEGHAGMVVAGGLNSIASARESGVRITFQSLSGLEDVSSFLTVRESLRRFG